MGKAKENKDLNHLDGLIGILIIVTFVKIEMVVEIVKF